MLIILSFCSVLEAGGGSDCRVYGLTLCRSLVVTWLSFNRTDEDLFHQSCRLRADFPRGKRKRPSSRHICVCAWIWMWWWLGKGGETAGGGKCTRWVWASCWKREEMTNNKTFIHLTFYTRAWTEQIWQGVEQWFMSVIVLWSSHYFISIICKMFL